MFLTSITILWQDRASGPPSSAVLADRISHRLSRIEYLRPIERRRCVWSRSCWLQWSRTGAPARTPHLDAMSRADTAVWFQRAYSGNPICSPTRASLHTGESPAKSRATTSATLSLQLHAALHLFILYDVCRSARHRAMGRRATALSFIVTPVNPHGTLSDFDIARRAQCVRENHTQDG